jgi:hypothetical protein
VFPERFTGLTGRWRITELHYFAEKGLLQAQQFVLLSPASKLHPRPHDTGVWTNAVYVVASRALKSSTCAATDASIQITRTTINGYRAVLSHGTQNGQPLQGLCVSHADGLAFGIRELGPHPYTSVTRLFRQHIRLLGGNAAHWTQNPFG